jgi:hypothetical protein
MSSDVSSTPVTPEDREQAHRDGLAAALLAARHRLALLQTSGADRAAIAAQKMRVRMLRDELIEAGRKSASPAAHSTRFAG